MAPFVFSINADSKLLPYWEKVCKYDISLFTKNRKSWKTFTVTTFETIFFVQLSVLSSQTTEIKPEMFSYLLVEFIRLVFDHFCFYYVSSAIKRSSKTDCAFCGWSLEKKLATSRQTAYCFSYVVLAFKAIRLLKVTIIKRIFFTYRASL